MYLISLCQLVLLYQCCCNFSLTFFKNHRRTRTVFDAALKVHQNIQKRDIEVGRNLGNWILRWLDRMKPSAQIRSPSPMKPSNGANSNVNMKRQATGPGSIQASRNQDSSRHLFTASRNTWTKTLPTISMMMRPPRPTGTVTQYRHLCIRGPEMASANYIGGVRGFEGVVRMDIMQYLLQK